MRRNTFKEVAQDIQKSIDFAEQYFNANYELRDFWLKDNAEIKTFPQMFGNTAGVYGGMGGAAMTTVQITAIYGGANLPVLVFQEGEFVYAFFGPGSYGTPETAAMWRDSKFATRRQMQKDNLLL